MSAIKPSRRWTDPATTSVGVTTRAFFKIKSSLIDKSLFAIWTAENRLRKETAGGPEAAGCCEKQVRR
jgi:hypothetical protein